MKSMINAVTTIQPTNLEIPLWRLMTLVGVVVDKDDMSHLVTRIHAQLELQNNIAKVFLGPVAKAGWSAALRHWNHVAAEGEGLKWPELSM